MKKEVKIKIEASYEIEHIIDKISRSVFTEVPEH